MMGRYVVLILFAFLVEGVFGDAAEGKSVNDGDPVILNSGVTKGPNDMVRWYFNNSLIALINGDPNKRCLYDGVGGMFRDRLMLDCKTGSLIITGIRAEHAGLYEAELKGEDPSGKTEKLNRDPKCESTKIIKKNGNLGKIIKSISLTVSASKADKNRKEHQNVPQDQMIGATSDSGKNKNEAQIVPEDKEKKICSCLPSAVVAGIVGVLLGAAVLVVGEMIFCRRSFIDYMKKNKQVPELVPENKSFLPAQNGKV